MVPVSFMLNPALNDVAGLQKRGKDMSDFSAFFADVLAAKNQQTGNKHSNVFFQSLFSDQNLQGHDLVAWLKKNIQNSIGSLETMTMDKDALSWFRKLLVHAGFNASRVDGILSALNENGNGKKLSVSELFAGIAPLEEEIPEENDMLPISALPFLHTALSQAGLEVKTIDTLLSDAKEEGEGIHLSRLISGLKGIDLYGESETGTFMPASQQINDFMGIDPSGKSEFGTFIPDSAERINEISQNTRYNYSFDEQNVRGMTLSDVIAELEDMLAGKSDHNFQQYLITEDIKGLLSHIKIEDEWATDTNLIKQMNIFSAMGRLKDNGSSFGEENKNSGKQNLFNNQINNPTGKELLFDRYLGTVGKTEQSEARGILFMPRKAVPSSSTKDEFSSDLTSRMSDTLSGKSRQSLELCYQGIKEGNVSNTFTHSSVKGGTPRTLPFYMMQQVNRQIFRAVQNGTKEILLQLKPPHLGRLKMSLETVNDVLRVSIITESQNAREILKSHTNELKTALLDQGIRLEKIDVRIDFNFEQSLAQTKQESKESQERRNPKFTIGQQNDDWDGDVAQTAGSMMKSDGLLDLMV